MIKSLMRGGRLRLLIKGTVQGVGFRPCVHKIATSLGLAGFVTNSPEGVVIEVEGTMAGLFPGALRSSPPPLAHIASMLITPVAPLGETQFKILESSGEQAFALVPPDTATCDSCLSEFHNPGDRRYRYPFINCTDCGPRYTITLRTPYDRPNTTMRDFAMCARCQAEYDDPSSRRFHAEPNACPACGPAVTLGGHTGEAAIGAAVASLRAGRILAVKGIGGFHLACDALNPDAVAELRTRKRRSNKPFALMAASVEVIRRYCEVGAREAETLTSPARPVVLLRKLEAFALPEAVAPGSAYIGFMLPYAPLHHLLLYSGPLVMTSGNLAEEPIVIDNDEAVRTLPADEFLLHNRAIFMRADDSVVMLGGRGELIFIRRARGFVPDPVALADDGPDVLGAGAELKNTFALCVGRTAVVSQHIGDMQNTETMAFFAETLDNLKAAYGAAPVALAHDLHPGYLSTRWALKQPGRLIAVQHHHAHMASVMAEHGLSGRGLGIILDGAGYGDDGTLWGGEFLISSGASYIRAAHLRPVAVPGGDGAVRHPWRMAISYALAALGADAPRALAALKFNERYGDINMILQLCALGEVSPQSSSMGRLFDAVAALLGICDLNTFEGEAPMALTAAAMRVWDAERSSYECRISDRARPIVLDFSPAIVRIIEDMLAGVPHELIAARFHRTAIYYIVRVARMIYCDWVALSGGSFQNTLLLDGVRNAIEADGMRLYTNGRVPLNDGGIALGQAYIAREVMRLDGRA